MNQTQSMSVPLTRQHRRRRSGNNRRKFKPTKVDGILYVVPPKSTKQGTKTSNPRTMISRGSRSSKRCCRPNLSVSTRPRLNPRLAHPANARFHGKEIQVSKLNANAAEFVPSVSLYASIAPGKTSFRWQFICSRLRTFLCVYKLPQLDPDPAAWSSLPQREFPTLMRLPTKFNNKNK